MHRAHFAVLTLVIPIAADAPRTVQKTRTAASLNYTHGSAALFAAAAGRFNFGNRTNVSTDIIRVVAQEYRPISPGRGDTQGDEKNAGERRWTSGCKERFSVSVFRGKNFFNAATQRRRELLSPLISRGERIVRYLAGRKKPVSRKRLLIIS